MSLPKRGSEAAPIRLLVVEDSELDFDLLIATLARDGPPLRAERVEDEAGMREALERGLVDAVLTDHNMPRFDSFAARFVFVFFCFANGCECFVGEELQFLVGRLVVWVGEISHPIKDNDETLVGH